MSTEIKLDTNAMLTLFPKDSKAYIDLQTAVISNFVRKNFKYTSDQLFKELITKSFHDLMNSAQYSRSESLESLIKNQIKDYFTYDYRTGYQLENHHKKSLKELAAKHIEEINKETIEEFYKNNLNLEDIIYDKIKEKLEVSLYATIKRKVIDDLNKELVEEKAKIVKNLKIDILKDLNIRVS